MCSIAGIASFNPQENFTQNIYAANQKLQHRGPDDEGYVFFTNENVHVFGGSNTPKGVLNHNFPYAPNSVVPFIQPAKLVLAHNRLSIIDLSYAGHQPMCDATKKYWIVFNGEIYNYKALKANLVDLGHQFYSETDSEVVLHAFMQWGENCVNKFEGMWAFAIYDASLQSLFLSRDRFGVKPLYYLLTNEVFSFASELKALYHFHQQKSTLNNAAVFDYLALGKIESEEQTLINNIFELPAGFNLTIDLKTPQVKKSAYYKLKFNDAFGNFEEKKSKTYLNDIRDLIKNAIHSHLQADVPVGTCLSGGIDSSVITGNIHRIIKEKPLQQIGNQQKTFTAVYENFKQNEYHWAKQMSEFAQCEWHTTSPTPKEFIEEFQKITYCQDIPFLGTSTYSQFKVMELVKQHGVKVTLDGQGADEVFGGYAPYYSSYMSEALKLFKVAAFIQNLKNFGEGFSGLKLALRYPLKHWYLKQLSPASRLHKLQQKQPELQFIQPDLMQQHTDRTNQLLDEFCSNFNQYAQQQLYGVGFKYLMRTGDRNSMHFSIESRVPFADDIHLIEYVYNIPAVYKIRNGQSKWLLRQSQKGIVPDNILNRKDKVGFSVPENEWFKQLKNEFLAILPTESDEFVDWNNLRNQYENIHHHAINTTTIRLWRLINFALWRQTFNI
ncbi:MAG: asparagine synthase (glutamine-hydrolyzing) [Vicingaceae bacterium]